MMRASCAMPSASNVSAAWRMVGQSDWLPMTIPTNGDCSAMLAQPLLFLGAVSGCCFRIAGRRHYRGRIVAAQANPGGAHTTRWPPGERVEAARPPFMNDPLTNHSLVLLPFGAV
jgi:hypothetical protein